MKNNPEESQWEEYPTCPSCGAKILNVFNLCPGEMTYLGAISCPSPSCGRLYRVWAREEGSGDTTFRNERATPVLDNVDWPLAKISERANRWLLEFEYTEPIEALRDIIDSVLTSYSCVDISLGTKVDDAALQIKIDGASSVKNERETKDTLQKEVWDSDTVEYQVCFRLVEFTQEDGKS